MPTTDGGIVYELYEGFPVYDFQQAEGTATEVYIMAWVDIDAFLLESFPQPFYVGTKLVYPLTRMFPGLPWLRTEKLRFEPFPNDKPATRNGTAPTYSTKAKVTINYRTPKFEEDDEAETFFTHRISIGGEFLTLPASGFKWSGETTTVQNDDLVAGKVIPTAEHQLTWDYVLTPPMATIRATIGKVNNAAFLGAAAETLLFLGADMEQETTTGGLRPWKVDYRMSERLLKQGGASVGWNYFFRPDTGNFERLLTRAGGAVYDQAPFLPLFTA